MPVGVTEAAAFFEWRALPRWPTIRSELWQHVELTLIAVGLGLAISVPLAVAAWRSRLVRIPVYGFATLLYVIPSVALFAFFVPITGIHSIVTAEVALTGYTLLILILNVVTGLQSVPPEIRDAAAGMGYSPLAAVIRVDLPQALPYIFGGLRVATTTVVGLVTVSAFIGLGGVGRLITTGFNADNSSEVVAGLVLSVALASAADLLLVAAERLAVPWSRRSGRRRGKDG